MLSDICHSLIDCVGVQLMVKELAVSGSRPEASCDHAGNRGVWGLQVAMFNMVSNNLVGGQAQIKMVTYCNHQAEPWSSLHTVRDSSGMHAGFLKSNSVNLNP